MPAITLANLLDDPRNANVCNAETLEKIQRNIKKSGLYPPLIVRPHPDKDGYYIILDGHHRKLVLGKLGYKEAECQVWKVDDHAAQLALATLNRLRGEDEPRKRAKLLESLSTNIPLSDLTQYIPESEKEIKDLMALLHLEWEAEEAKIKEQIAREESEMPIPFACMIAPADFPDVEQALAQYDGADKGQKLVSLCRFALKKEKTHASQ